MSPGLEAERLRLVIELGRRVTSIMDLDVLLPEAAGLIARAFHYDIVGINLLDPLSGDRLYQAAAYPPERKLPPSFRVPVGGGLTGWVAKEGAPRLANDVRSDPLYIPGPGRERTQAELDVPLQLGGVTIGVLNVESERAGAFSGDDVPYLESLASLLAQAIENARLAARARELAAAEERTRIARDLHDETVQALVAVERQLDLLEMDLDDLDRARARIESVHALVDRTLDGVRRMSQNLRPAVLEDLGLVAALQAHAEELAALGLHVTFEVRGAPRRLAAAVEYAVYRVAQEALSNALRHAGVDRAGLLLDFGDEELLLRVEDAGGGGARETREGQGMVGMRDRASEIGARLDVNSPNGAGTRVELRLPLKLTLLETP
jgi:two-component system sensor histidine kinase UhpB